MLMRTSSTPLEATYRCGGRGACLSGGSGGLGGFSACVFARVSATMTRETQWRRKLTLGRHVQRVDCFGWCRRMGLLCLLSSFAFLALLLYARQPLHIWPSQLSPFVTLSSLLIAPPTATAKVSLLLVIPSTWPLAVMKDHVLYSKIPRLCFLG